MKHFLIIFFGMITLPVMSQKWELNPQFQSGLSYTDIKNDVYNDHATKAKFTYRYGLTTNLLFANNLGITAGGFITVPTYEGLYTPFTPDSILLPHGEDARSGFETVNISLHYLTLPLRIIYQHNNMPVRLSAGLSYHTYLGSNESTELFRYPWYNDFWLSAHAGIQIHFAISERVKFATGIEMEAPLTDFMARDDGVRVFNEGNRIWQFYLPVQLIIKLN